MERELRNALPESLKNKRIFLTGGTGFFGKNLLSFFMRLSEDCNLDIKVFVLSRNFEQFSQNFHDLLNHDFIECLHGDVRDFVFPREEFDFIIHAATPASSKLEAESPNEMSSIIIEGTKRVVEFAKICGAQKLLLTSSGAVYGAQPPDIDNIYEEYPTQPASVYGKGKLEAEKICAGEFSGSVIARCFAFVGPYLPLDIHYAIGNFIRDGLRGEAITVTGDGRNYRSYLYSDELVHWLLTILLNGNGVYNVGSEHAISIGDLARLISSRFDVPVKIIGKPNIDVPVPRYVPSTRLASETLGLSQNIPLEESIERTIEWHKRWGNF